MMILHSANVTNICSVALSTLFCADRAIPKNKTVKQRRVASQQIRVSDERFVVFDDVWVAELPKHKRLLQSFCLLASFIFIIHMSLKKLKLTISTRMAHHLAFSRQVSKRGILDRDEISIRHPLGLVHGPLQKVCSLSLKKRRNLDSERELVIESRDLYKKHFIKLKGRHHVRTHCSHLPRGHCSFVRQRPRRQRPDKAPVHRDPAAARQCNPSSPCISWRLARICSPASMLCCFLICPEIFFFL